MGVAFETTKAFDANPRYESRCKHEWLDRVIGWSAEALSYGKVRYVIWGPLR
jgi:hypothetical protein